MYRVTRDIVAPQQLDAASVKMLEQEAKMEDLKFQLHNHTLSLTMLQAEKQHALSSISQDMTGQMSSGYLVQRRPMSAGSEAGAGACRRPNYHFLNRAQPSSRNSLMQVSPEPDTRGLDMLAQFSKALQKTSILCSNYIVRIRLSSPCTRLPYLLYSKSFSIICTVYVHFTFSRRSLPFNSLGRREAVWVALK